MEEFNIIQSVLERNGYKNTTVLEHMTPQDYVKNKMEHAVDTDYSINIKVETVEITDETVWMQFTYVMDRDEAVDFVTDIYIAPTDKACAVITGKHLKPAVYKAEYEEYLWRENYFVYDNKLVAIMAVGNAEICYKICDIPKKKELDSWLQSHKLDRLSRAEATELLSLSSTTVMPATICYC